MRRYLWTIGLCALAATAIAQPPEGGRLGNGRGPNGGEPGEFGIRGPNGGPEGEFGGPGGPGGLFPNPMFDAVDANGDGVITTRELRRAVAALKKLDADGDGNITLAEASPQGGPGGDPAQMIDRLMQRDANGDGKLTAGELPEFMVRIVQEADTNGDGALDRQELAAHMQQMRNRFQGGEPGQFGGPGGGPQQMAQQMMQNDRNRDGRLTPDEVPPQMMPVLRGGDTNGDGAIDAQELQAVVQRMSQRGGGGPFGPSGPPGNGGPNRGPGSQ